MTTKHFDWIAPGALPSGRDDRVVSSVRLTFSPRHAHLRVWNRGAFAGELTVELGDWHELVRLLGFAVDPVDQSRIDEELRSKTP